MSVATSSPPWSAPSWSAQSRARHPARRCVALVAATVALVAAGAVTFAAPASAASKKCSSAQTPGKSRIGHFYGISRATSRCDSSEEGSSEVDPGTASAKPYQGTPPLINHGGPVMSTPSTGNQVVVTPVFWAPTGYSFTASYKNVIDTYLANVAHDSDTTTNVFASTYQYSGSNGKINYRMSIAASPILDVDSYPSAGCTTNSGGVYSDNTGYSTCLDDAQIQTELTSVISNNHLSTDLGHLVVLFLPKGVESCFYAGNPNSQQCTLNSTPSAAYCAYHSAYGTTTAPKVYALMPFPAYQSPTGYTCAGEGLSNSGPAIQSPNADADADVEISPLSHEMAESITDPEGNAWLDSSGNENGDDCAYIYGALSGSAGSLYNQTVNGAHYLTQEEFSNAAYVPNTSGCVQGIQPVVPTVSSVSPTGGTGSGGGTVTITGTGFAGTSAVSFGGTSSSTYTVNDPTSITATVPAGSGVVDVTVTTGAGSSATNGNDKYTYTGVAPTVTSVAPSSGPATGGTSVTVTGTGFSGVTGVSFGGSAGLQVNVTSSTQLTVVAPAHSVGTVDVQVSTSIGTSATSAADQFTYVAAPTVTSVSPSSGPAGGGGSVTITGTNLAGATGVSFGGNPSLSFAAGTTQITASAPAGIVGTVDVTVTTLGGTSAETAADQYTYIAAPAVTSLAPASGPTSGGTAVTIGGSDFTGATAVSFGGQPAANVVVVSSSQITADAPAGSAGTVDVTVESPAGTSPTSAADQFTYLAVPTVTSVSPNSGPTSGGQSLTVSGSGFASGAVVKVGGSIAGSVSVISPTELSVTTPSHVAGTVDVTVATGGGTSATGASDRYTYLAPPAVSRVSPNSGPTAGGTSITITGTGFAPGDTVKVGGTAASSIVVVSSTSITTHVPAHPAGTVDVQVVSPGGTSAPVKADHYSYLAKPRVSRLSSSRGRASGGRTITITGSGFVAGTKVRFGKVAGTSLKYVSATKLRVHTPRHSKRTVNVRVVTPGGRSATSTATRYTFR